MSTTIHTHQRTQVIITGPDFIKAPHTQSNFEKKLNDPALSGFRIVEILPINPVATGQSQWVVILESTVSHTK